ncbi:putative Cro-like protein [Gammaproteobacteria bacterium MOLA455]|nr:putative Cro-like protein [Gammaproteobacteria bacterium MOLA455]
MDRKEVHNWAMKRSMSTELAKLMQREGISQSALSRATRVPQPTINRILSQVTQDPRRDSMISIANYFGVPVESLYGSSAAQKSTKKDPKAVEDVFNRILALSKADRKALFSQVADKFNGDE